MIEIKNLTKSFGNHKVLDNITLSFPKNGIVALFGDSGSGKTTLLNCIGGIDTSYLGEICIKNTCISNKNDEDLRFFRINSIGYVFQNFNLLNLGTVNQNVCLCIDAISNQAEQIKQRRVDDVLSYLKISNLKKMNVNKLSGGEKQRVAIARAIVNSPDIILCDEPTGALDENNSVQIYEILKSLSKNHLIIIASHDKLVKEYADQVYQIVDGTIIQRENIASKEITYPRPIIGSHFKHKKPKVSLKFKITNALQKMKSKKFRTLITNGILSLSLTGIGLSFLIMNSISNKITEAFTSLTNGNQMVMSLKNENPNVFNGVYSAPINKVKRIYEKYSYYLSGYGATYLVNFEDFFKTKNEYYVSSTSYKYKIDSLSTRSINDYRWIEKSDSSPTYPFLVDSLNNDELILGLNYVDMVNLCFHLKIQRSYSSLGEYIRKNDLLLTLDVQNSSWEYDDEQIFKVMGVKESNSSCFYHYEHLWNQTVFEEMMRLPSDDDKETYFPWEMYKIYYLKTLIDSGDFIDMTLMDEEMYDFVLEKTNYSYHPLLCKINEICKENRVIVYYTDKYGLDTNLVAKLSENERHLKNYYFVSDYGYASYASNMLSGFSKNLFVSLSKNDLDLAIDADTAIREENNSKIELPKGVVNGNYLNGISGGLRFSTKTKSLIQGRLPKNIHEILISKGLSEKLSNDSFGKELFIGGVSNEYLNPDGTIEKEYETTEVVIVGIVDEEKDYLYHDSNWSISFFRDCLGISMFSLTPKAVVFELDNNVDVDALCERYQNLLTEYSFTSPSLEIRESVKDTLNYAKIILISFTIISTLISIILLGTVITLNIMESKEDIKLFKYIGILKKDVNSLFVTQATFQGLIASLLASIEVIIIDIIMSFAIGNMLGASLSYKVSFVPILIVILSAILISYFTSKICVKWLNRKM